MSMTIRIFKRLKLVLIYMWIAFLVINLLCFLLAYQKNFIGEESMSFGLKLLSKCYLPYLGVILGYFWTVNADKSIKTANNNPTGIITALICSGIWNLLILFFSVPIVFKGDVEKAIKNIDLVSNSFSWLVAGSIGFYFGKDKNG